MSTLDKQIAWLIRELNDRSPLSYYRSDSALFARAAIALAAAQRLIAELKKERDLLLNDVLILRVLSEWVKARRRADETESLEAELALNAATDALLAAFDAAMATPDA